MTLKSTEALAAIMRQKDFNGSRLARYAGCSRQFISQVMKGEKRSMTPKLAVNIAEALDVPVEFLFDVSLSSTTRRKDGR